MQKLYESVDRLIDHATKKLGLTKKNYDYARNGVLGILGLAFPSTGAEAGNTPVNELLDEFVRQATTAGIFAAEDAEKYCDAVMGELSLAPHALEDVFEYLEKKESGDAAMSMLYNYCVNNNYVKKAQLDKNPRFDIGGLTVTINKAKPEFRDAKKAAAGNAVGGGYPACSICHQNEGFGGRGKRTLRTVELKLGGQDWFWQYSPYGYFYKHGIAVNYEHIPMHVDRQTFERLMDFVDRFPKFFIGCNAALPRIGGSVLAHDHYQGGGESLPLHKARAAFKLKDKATGAAVEILDWPGTAVRVVDRKRESVTDVSDRIRAAWVDYDAPELGIIHEDGDGVHNAISPTVVKTRRGYEMTLILRSNITSERYPDGVFHAHPEFHVIKKESIGLIEAQGLFILPGRLERELGEIENCICAGEALPESLKDFEFIYGEIANILDGKRERAEVQSAIKQELGSVCYRILQNTAVFKDAETTERFIENIVCGA